MHHNILNHEAPANWVLPTVKDSPDHVKRWFLSTFVRHLKSVKKHLTTCVLKAELDQPFVKSLRLKLPVTTALLEHLYHTLEQAPENPKLKKALESYELMWWSPPASRVKLTHWRDFCHTLPARDIRMTVEQMKAAVDAWDKQLKKQKLMVALTEGVKKLETPPLSKPDRYLVELETKDAFNAEGAIMKHCVASYHGKKHIRILSLRSTEQERPLATIEVVKESIQEENSKGKWVYVPVESIQQVRGFANANIPKDIESDLKIAALGLGIRWFVLTDDCDEDDEDDYDDEEDYDEDDDGDEEDDDC